MTHQEIEALLKMLAEWEREELELLMQERREAEGNRDVLNQYFPVVPGPAGYVRLRAGSRRSLVAYILIS